MDLRNLEAIWEAVTPLRFDWIQVEVSAVCHADCAYCPKHSYQEGWDGGLMSMRTFERLAPNFRWTDLVFLQGWGEPLLHPHLWNMVRKVRSTGAKVGFTTSGAELGSHSNRLLEEQVDIVAVSLAGATAPAHERLRRGCSFASIDKALRKIRELKNTCQMKKPAIHLAVILLKSNWQDMAKLPDLAAGWGVDQVVVSHLSHIGTVAMAPESLLAFPEMWPEVEAAMEDLRKKTEARGIGFHYYHPEVDGPLPTCTENALNACFVSHRGDVLPCVMTGIPVKTDKTMDHWFEHKPYPLERCVFGNVHEKPLREIWKGDKAREFRRLFKDRLKVKQPGLESLPAPCRQCYKLFEK